MPRCPGLRGLYGAPPGGGDTGLNPAAIEAQLPSFRSVCSTRLLSNKDTPHLLLHRGRSIRRAQRTSQTRPSGQVAGDTQLLESSWLQRGLGPRLLCPSLGTQRWKQTPRCCCCCCILLGASRRQSLEHRAGSMPASLLPISLLHK